MGQVHAHRRKFASGRAPQILQCQSVADGRGSAVVLFERDPFERASAVGSVRFVDRSGFLSRKAPLIGRALNRELYLPIPFVEALGRATIARAQLEMSFDLLITVVALEPSRAKTCWPRDPFAIKAKYLETLSRSRLLKHDWWRALRRIASEARALDQHYSEAAMSTLYSRGGGALEEAARGLAEKLRLSPPPLRMTPDKIEVVADQFRGLAWETCALASTLLAAAERLSIGREQL